MGSSPTAASNNTTPASDLWAASAAGQLAAGGPTADPSGTAITAATAMAPTAGGGTAATPAADADFNDAKVARARIDATHLAERRAEWKIERAKVHAARIRVEHACSASERQAALHDLASARAAANVAMHRLATRQVQETRNLAQFTTGGSAPPTPPAAAYPAAGSAVA